MTPRQAIALQQRLRDRVVIEPLPRGLRTVAGLDVAFSADGAQCIAGVVVWDVVRREVVETCTTRRPLRFPYVPGLLSFREAPALLAVLRRLRHVPDVLMCDGQGFAHPRRFGIACHVGVVTGMATIGCAKSRLVGEHGEPAERRGSRVALWDRGERIGTVLRTRTGVRPIYVSIGHRSDLPSACALALRCAVGYRLPEPTRLADQLVAREKRGDHRHNETADERG